MSSRHVVRNRLRPVRFLVLSAFVAVATYFEFIYAGPPTVFDIALWLLVVPWLLSTTVEGVRDHPLYRPISAVVFLAVGVLQYLDGEWLLLAALFVLAGVGQLAAVGLDRYRADQRPA